MTDPKAILTKIVELIDRDVKFMDELDMRLTADDTLALSRYSKSLLEIINHNSDAKAKQQDELSKLAPDKLKELVLKTISKENQ